LENGNNQELAHPKIGPSGNASMTDNSGDRYECSNTVLEFLHPHAPVLGVDESQNKIQTSKEYEKREETKSIV
jgi:hypothetical protein